MSVAAGGGGGRGGKKVKKEKGKKKKILSDRESAFGRCSVYHGQCAIK